MPPAASTEKTLARARKATKARDWATAIDLFQTVLSRFPGNSRARQGVAALRQTALPEILKSAQDAQQNGKLAEAEHKLALAAALAPELPEIGLALAANRLESGRAPAALAATEVILAHHPEHLAALNAQARALREMGRGAASRKCLMAALKLDGSNPQTLNNLGILERAQGNPQAAETHYRKAIAQSPRDAALHRNLAHAITYTPAEPHLDEMRNLLAALGAQDPKAAALHFAIFKALDDLGDHPAAFASLQKGNRLTKTQLRYDFQTDAIPYALSKALFQTPLSTETKSETTPDGLRPIFVTGLPRSGTTLIERILSQADGVQPCGELTVVQVAVARMLREIMAREDKSITTGDIELLRAALLEGLQEYSDGSPILIDKMPLNFRWIGYICAALPEARIVHVARDPMAVAWSLYRYSFAGVGNGFVYDPQDIARFMILHRDLLTHWRKICPGRIFDLNYADLVSNTKDVTRNMAEAVGLPWSEDMLSPERANSQVLTASAEQVRKPIYGGSDQQWKRYASQLGPLSKVLEAAGILV